MAVSIVPHKHCSKCKQSHPPTSEYFGADKRSSDGLRSQCRQCEREDAKRFRKEHPDKVSAKQKRYRENHPDRVREAQKLWGDANPDKLRAKNKRYRAKKPLAYIKAQKKYYQNHTAKVRQDSDRYRKEHPGMRRIESHRRRSKIRALPNNFTNQNWRHALDYFHGCCAYCGNPPSLFDVNTTLHQEHFTPMTKGGGYTPDNIVPACQTCNLSKSNKKPHEWLVSHFGKRKAKQILARITAYFEWVNHESR